MLNTIKTNMLKIHRAPLLCGVFVTAALAVLLPISVGAQCTNWDASGESSIRQQGLNAIIYFALDQNGRVITGTANYKGISNHQDVENSGTVDGTIDGHRFNVQIFWKSGEIGIYNGEVLPSGRLDGEGYEKRSPNVRVPWHSNGVLKCSPLINPRVVVQSTPPRPKPIKSSGKARPSEPAPSPPPMKVPGIIATSAIFPSPGSPTGFVILTWDGGPDHPYAEVWFKVNDGEQVFMVEQGKGGRQVTVERGKFYTYILTDAGTTLASVNVLVPRR